MNAQTPEHSGAPAYRNKIAKVYIRTNPDEFNKACKMKKGTCTTLLRWSAKFVDPGLL